MYMATQADITRGILAAQNAQTLARSYAAKAMFAAQDAQRLYGQFLRLATTWKGSWDPTITYHVNDMVESGGSSYICLVQHSNHEPPNDTYWDLAVRAGGEFVSLDSVNSTGTTLAAYDSTGVSVGTRVFVESIGAFFQFGPSVLTVDNITVVDAVGVPGSQWVRINQHNRSHEEQLVWYIDPQNVYGTSHDENDGMTAATALRSYSEHARRWFDAFISSNATVTVRSNFDSGDEPAYNFRVLPGQTVTFEGVPTQVYPASGSATIGTWTPEASIAAADDNQLVDAGIPVSFTASGVLADGILLQRTNSTPQYFFAAKDLGGAAPAATLRTSNPYTLVGDFGSLASGDTYTASSLPEIGAVRFSGANDGSIVFRFLFHQDIEGQTDTGSAIRYLHCWRNNTTYLRCFWAGNLATQLATNSELVIDASQIKSIHLNVPPLFAYSGMVRSDGTGEVIVTALAAVSTNRLTLQGVAMNTRGKTVHMTRLTCHDVTRAGRGPCVASSGGLVCFIVSGCIGGKGSTGKLLNVGEGAGATRSAGEIRIAGSGAVCVAGSTSDPAPITVNNTGFTVAQLPSLGGGFGQVNLRGGVDFQPALNAVTNGAQAILIGSTGPNGIITPGAPAGWKLEYVLGQAVYTPFWQ